MQLVIEIVFIIMLIALFVQDIKDREVSLYLLILGILIGGSLHYIKSPTEVFLVSILMNFVFVSFIFGILILYVNFKMKQAIFSVFGKGDLLFFILMALSLPSLAFVVVFVFSLFFSLIVFSIFKSKLNMKTVPLAGLQSLFLGLSIIVNLIFPAIDLYLL